MRRVRHDDAARRVLALHQPFLQCGNSGSGGEPWRRRKPALHLWRRNEKDVPDPRFSLFGFSSRRNSCSGRAFALHPFTLQNERRIDHGDFFPSSRLRVPEGRAPCAYEQALPGRLAGSSLCCDAASLSRFRLALRPGVASADGRLLPRPWLARFSLRSRCCGRFSWCLTARWAKRGE